MANSVEISSFFLLHFVFQNHPSSLDGLIYREGISILKRLTFLSEFLLFEEWVSLLVLGRMIKILFYFPFLSLMYSSWILQYFDLLLICSTVEGLQNFVEPSFCVTKRTFSERQNLFVVILRMGKL